MREHLFRGKPKKGYNFFSKIWTECCKDGFVYGSLVVSDNKYYICVSAMCNINTEINNGTTSMIEVIPESIGEFTGLTDKKGMKIFEGDILERKCKQLFNHSQKMIVKFIPVKSCFAAVDVGGGNVTFICDYINNKYELEVIGNTTDNPELLEVR